MTKLCECGCGLPAPIATRSGKTFRRGEPQRYICGHVRPPSALGRKATPEQRRRISEAHMGQVAWNKGKTCPQLSGANQGNWKGGLRVCIDCGVRTHSYKATRCKSCAMKVTRKGKRPASWIIALAVAAMHAVPHPFKGKKRPNHSGPNCHLWRGGVTPINERIRRSVEYKAWRQAVYERDGFTCTNCGATKVELNADHIKSFALFPDLRFDVSNGRALCVSCHKLTPTYLNRWYVEDAAANG